MTRLFVSVNYNHNEFGLAQHLSLESVDKAYQDAVQDLRRFLWDFTYLCWANPTGQVLFVDCGSSII
jgi:hypothetical protein